MRRNKKGALELSMNAVVILILAITLLGLALAFIKGMFSQITETGLQIIKGADLSKLVNPPTRDNPLTVTPSEFGLRNKEQKVIGVSFMNTETSAKSYLIGVRASNGNPCPNGGVCSDGVKYSYTSSAASLKPDEVAYWKIPVVPSLPGTTTFPEVKLATMVVCEADTAGTACLTDGVTKMSDIVMTVNS